MTTASAVAFGDVLDQAVGPSLVLRVLPEHGCVSFLVCAPGGGRSRWLTYWPKQAARVLRSDEAGARQILERRAASRDAFLATPSPANSSARPEAVPESGHGR